MKFYEYMKLRNGVGSRGTIKFALSDKEANLLGITTNKGWTKKFRNLEIDDETLKALVDYAKECKVNYNKSTKRLETNFETSDNKFVYLIHNPSTNYYKIGISVDPKKRSKDLSYAAGVVLKLKAFWKVKNYSHDIEKELHKTFRAQRCLGEWFNFDGIEHVADYVQNKITCEYKRVI